MIYWLKLVKNMGYSLGWITKWFFAYQWTPCTSPWPIIPYRWPLLRTRTIQSEDTCADKIGHLWNIQHKGFKMFQALEWNHGNKKLASKIHDHWILVFCFILGPKVRTQGSHPKPSCYQHAVAHHVRNDLGMEHDPLVSCFTIPYLFQLPLFHDIFFVKSPFFSTPDENACFS